MILAENADWRINTPNSVKIDHRITRLPILILYPHSRCNCRCLMCDIWRSKAGEEIDPGEIVDLLPELRDLGVEQIALSGGEALLHHRLREICETLHDAGIRVTVLSTGLLLARNAEWMAAFVDDVVVSLDGPESIHDQIRGVTGAYRKLRDGVTALRTARPGFRVTARCVVQKANFASLRQTVRAARDIGLGQISFLAADVTSEAFNRLGGLPDDRTAAVALSPDDLRGLATELALMESELADEFSRGFIAETPAKLRNRVLRHYGALIGEGSFAPVTCSAPWVSCVIESNGDVRPCFFHAPIGNVRKAGSLERVLNSPVGIAFRRDLDVRTDPTCVRCVCSLSKPHRDAENGS